MKDSDSILVERCLSGDLIAFDELVDKYKNPIFHLSFRMIGNYDDAEEITQITFVKAYDNLNSFNRKYRFFSWIYRIAINESINFKNRQRNKIELEPGLQSQIKNPEMITEESDISERIQSALEQLDITYRLPLVLKHFLNYSYKELSNILEIPEKTVKSRLYTGRQLLKDILLKDKVI